MKWTKTKRIFAYTTYALITMIVICVNFNTNKMHITESAKNAFIDAINKEKDLYISQINVQYHQKYSPNNIGGEEKKNWSDQAYFIAKDSVRNHLDSLFKYEMHKINKYTNTAIGYTYNGKRYNSRDEKFIRKATLVQEYKFRINYNKKSDITLQAYIYTPTYALLLNNIYTYILLAVMLIPITCYIIYRRNKKENLSKGINSEDGNLIKQRKYRSTKWIEIHEGYYWDNNHNTLRYNTTQVILRGNNIKIFRKFISNEDFFLSHTDISKLYEKVESVEVKDRAYHLIKSLKECIAILDINVVSIRGKGYKLVFNSVSSNYNNN